jgi:cellobiose phosphorylase
MRIIAMNRARVVPTRHVTLQVTTLLQRINQLGCSSVSHNSKAYSFLSRSNHYFQIGWQKKRIDCRPGRRVIRLFVEFSHDRDSFIRSSSSKARN